MLSPYDRQIVRRDERLPGLATLLDEHQFARVLRNALPHLDLRKVRIDYLRYKPGANCLARFQLACGRKRLSGYAKAYGSDAAEKLEKASQRSSVTSRIGPGRLLLANEGLEVALFPNDSKLPALQCLQDSRSRRTLLRRLFAPHSALRRGKVRELRYKPQRRFVGRVDMDNEPQALIKFYTERGFHQASGTALRVHSRDVLQVPRMIGVLEREQVVGYEWLSGVALDSRCDGQEFDSEVISLVGTALAELHGQKGIGLSCRTRDDLGDSLRAALDGVLFTLPDVSCLIAQVSEALHELVVAEHVEWTPIHGDFYASQVLTHAGRISIIDLDDVVLGNPASDIGLFLAHLEIDVLTGKRTPADVANVKRALLNGYSQVRAAPRESVIELHTAIGLVQLAPHHFRGRAADWWTLTEATLMRAAELLVHAATISRRSVSVGMSR